jgi:hypothetical protein
LVFYTLHTASFGVVQSHKILETLLSWKKRKKDLQNSFIALYLHSQTEDGALSLTKL